MFRDDPSNLGGRGEIVKKMTNHHKALLNIKPTIDNKNEKHM